MEITPPLSIGGSRVWRTVNNRIPVPNTDQTMSESIARKTRTNNLGYPSESAD